MAISGKSSSVAALLLLVAVLATGANALVCPLGNANCGANCVVVSNCKLNATLGNCMVPIHVIDPLVNCVVQPGHILTLVGPCLLHDLKIVIGGKTYILRVADIQALVNSNAVVRLEILCNGASPCGPNALTINIYVNLNVLGLVKLHLVGSVCALLLL